MDRRNTGVAMDQNCLTACELKAKLYQSFQQRGLVDSLKSELRTKLVRELRYASQGPRPSSPVEAVTPPDGGTLMHRAANSLVADHLRHCQYEYSLAVFLPESETGKDQLFTIRELLEMLHVHPESKLFRNLVENIRTCEHKGFLWQMLCELTSNQGTSTQDRAIQVGDHSPEHAVNSVEKKLSAIDKLFEAEGYHGSSNQALTAKLLSLQRKMEAQTKEEIEKEVRQFKEMEGKRIEMEERDKCRKEIARNRREMEHTYQVKVEGLQERERSTLERLRRHQEMVERETYSQRQSLLEELQTLRQKEVELKREDDHNKRAASLEESHRKTTEENLRAREGALSTIEETHEKKYKERIRQYDIEMQNKMAERQQALDQREARIREEKSYIENEKQLQIGLREELKEKKARIAELELLYQQARYESVGVSKRHEVLTERLRDMVDYQSVKEENAVLRRELDNEKRRLKEVINEQKIERARYEDAMRTMTETISRPPAQLLTLQTELHRLQSQLEQERNLTKHKEVQFHTRLQEECDHNRELGRTLDQQTNQMREMNREIADLRLTQRQTQIALSNEIYGKTTPGVPSGQVRSSATHERPVHDRSSPTNHDDSSYLSRIQLDRSGFAPMTADDSDVTTSDPSLAFLEENRARFHRLEQEAETLDKNYQGFQQRGTSVDALPATPVSRRLFTNKGSMGIIQASCSPSKKATSKKSPSTVKGMHPPHFTNGVTHHPQALPVVSRNIPLQKGNSSPAGVGSTRPDQRTCRNGINGSADEEGPSIASGSLSMGSLRLESTMAPPVQPDVPASGERQAPVVHQQAAAPADHGQEWDIGQSMVETLLPDPDMSSHDGPTADEGLRRRMDEDEREEREWEEQRRQRELERKKKEQEAREREQAMLRNLERQEQQSQPMVHHLDQEIVRQDRRSQSPEERSRTEEGNTAGDGVQIDPVMQKYMQMVQDKRTLKQGEGHLERNISRDSSHSEAGLQFDVLDADEPSSAGHVSDATEDPFDDW